MNLGLQGSNRVAVVTGASRGIGQAIALALAGEAEESRRFVELARGVEIAEQDDRERLLEDLATIG